MKSQAPIKRILHAVITLEVSKGHLKWKVSELARKVKVSRPLIYYHFGKTKKEILEKSIILVAEEFFGLSPERVKMLKTGKARDSLLLSRKLFLSTPAFALFYLKWRMEKSPIQKKLIEIERRYQAMLQDHFPGLSGRQIEALHGIFYSVVTAPFLSEESIDLMVKLPRKV